MLPAARPLTAGLVVLVALLAGCGADDSPPGADPSAAVPPASATATASAAVDATSTEAARQPHILVLTATGKATIDKFTYVLDGRATEGGPVRLPWRQSVDVPADGRTHEWSLTIEYRRGNVELVGMFNGQVLTRTNGRSTGTGTVSISGSVLG
ncbi:hypothetical protein EF879_04245 [Micromonospora sp. HM5-17]|jgi:hypothetical protein|nr:hypothetical protein EF879_04245 [Micromonospora sp. HM5-17]